MKKKTLSVLFVSICIILSTFITAAAAENPYNYSSEPSRAIYYVLPTMKGNDVKWVQSALNAFGNYGLSIDGSFGPACKKATKSFSLQWVFPKTGHSVRQQGAQWLIGLNKMVMLPVII